MLLATGCGRNALFAAGRAPDSNLMTLLARIQERRGCRPGEWRMISARRKMGRTLFEIEERSGQKVRRIVGKICRHEKAKVLYQALRGLWLSGWRLPDRYTVSEPVAFFPAQCLILQEKAPGRPALEAILAGGETAEFAGQACAQWLARLQVTQIFAPAADGIVPKMTFQARGLQAILPGESDRIGRIQQGIEEVLSAESTETVPSHGDFHGLNVLIHADKRVTGIDLDKYSKKEPEADAAYFLAETAAQGFLGGEGFSCTQVARSAFLKTYLATRGSGFNRERAGALMASTFLQHLHFELVLLKTGHIELAAPWLEAAESAVFEGNLELTG